MIIAPQDRVRLQRVLEEHLSLGEEGESRNFLLIMLSLIYDLEEMENRRRRFLPEDSPDLAEPEAHFLQEENRRLKALLDTLLSRVRFAATGIPETAH
ncbi:MAG: hypothetical protein LBP61_01360 [Desulfovibrio sp.]|jgi:hypothetical protein|nr:hypothetical protein [Desulfovibrio sp.]